MERLPEREHLHRLEHVWISSPIYFVTANTLKRRPVLVPNLAGVVADALAGAAERNGWVVGRYVVMPDHVHFFCQDDAADRSLQAFVGGFKQLATRLAWEKNWQGGLWQPGFFDHLLRSDESYGQKWEYVRMNPVRAALCGSAEEWPHQGEIAVLRTY